MLTKHYMITSIFYHKCPDARMYILRHDLYLNSYSKAAGLTLQSDKKKSVIALRHFLQVTATTP